MQTQKIPNTEIQYFDEDNVRWYRMRDITEFLEYPVRNGVHMFYRLHRNQIEVKAFDINGHGGIQLSIFITQPSLKYLLTKTRREKVYDLAMLLGFEKHLAAPCKETLHCGQLKQMFPAVKFKREYTVDKYRVDLYSKKYNIIVECDEMAHQGYDKEKDAERTQKINEVLDNPSWVRFNPDAKDFTIIEVISGITTILCNMITD